MRAQVGDRFSLDVTGAYSVIAIAGPEAQTVLRRMTHLHHFPSGGEIAHVQGHVLERDGGYWVLCPQEYGHYVWEVAVDRASALGGGPVGVDALPERVVKDIFFRKEIIKRPGPLKKHYDVVIVGGGSHGLATAYYLAMHHGITDVAILEKSYIGSGAAGRNTTIIRANYRTPEGAAFYKESVKLYEKLSADLDFNLMFSQHGHFTLAHSDRSLVVQNERAEVNKLLGIDSRVIDRDEVKKLCPQINIGEDVTWPIQGALYHPPGGIIRHDAVVWGYAKQAGPARRRDPPGRRGDGLRRQGRQGARRPDEPGRRLLRASSSAPPPAGRRRSRRSPACRCRSPARSCRRS